VVQEDLVSAHDLDDDVLLAFNLDGITDNDLAIGDGLASVAEGELIAVNFHGTGLGLVVLALFV